MKRAILVLTLVIIGTVLFLFFSSGNPSPEQIYAEEFQPYQAPTNLRGTDITEMDDDFMMGLIKYDDSQYPEAIRHFQLTLEKDSLNYTARFLMAVGYMAVKDFGHAEGILKKMSTDDSHLFIDQVRWYLGLLYLTDKDSSNDGLAKGIFDQILSKYLKQRVARLPKIKN